MKRRVRWDRIVVTLAAIAAVGNIVETIFQKNDVNISLTPCTPQTQAIVNTENTQYTVLGKDAIKNANLVYSERLGRNITDYEFYLLKMICCSESGLESFEGKIAVVATVLNRMEDPTFPDTVYEVIFQKNQFSSATNGKFHNSYGELIWEELPSDMQFEAECAVYIALSGEDPTSEPLDGGALFFYNPDYCSEEENALRANISQKYRIGNHVFYRIWD